MWVRFLHAGPKKKMINSSQKFIVNNKEYYLQYRYDVAQLVNQGIGIELGTAGGNFARRVLEHSNLDFLYTVDAYSDEKHPIDEYRCAVQNLMPWRHRSQILRMRFDQAVHVFTDNYFDFVYIDGYADTGQEAGKTLQDWWPKLKPGGIFAGDDYHEHYPLVVQYVDEFARIQQRQLHVIHCEPLDDWASKYPTWFIIKD